MLVISAGLLGLGIALPRLLKNRKSAKGVILLCISFGVYSLTLWLQTVAIIQANRCGPDCLQLLEKISSIAIFGSLILTAWIWRRTRMETWQTLRPLAAVTTLCVSHLSLWVLISTWIYPLPGILYELLWGINVAFFIITVSNRHIHFKDLKLSTPETADMTPSFRVAFSGIQVLNHAIKNKLLTMEMVAGTIKAKLPNHPSIAQELRLIEQSVAHMNEMMVRIRERTKAVLLMEQPHNIRSIVDACLLELKPMKFSNISIGVDPQLSAVIQCDATHMKEVLYNILINSMEAIGYREGTIRIYSGLCLPGRWYTLIVEDNGPGIPGGILNRLFEPYFTTKAGKSNFGLGLSYCYNVMKASLGSIKICNNRNGKGTSVILSFHPKKVLAYPGDIDPEGS